MILDSWVYMNKVIVKHGIKYYVGDYECFRSLVDAKEYIRTNFSK